MGLSSAAVNLLLFFVVVVVVVVVIVIVPVAVAVIVVVVVIVAVPMNKGPKCIPMGLNPTAMNVMFFCVLGSDCVHACSSCSCMFFLMGFTCIEVGESLPNLETLVCALGRVPVHVFGARWASPTGSRRMMGTPKGPMGLNLQ